MLLSRVQRRLPRRRRLLHPRLHQGGANAVHAFTMERLLCSRLHVDGAFFSSASYLNKRTAPISSNFQIPQPSSFLRLCSSTPSNFCASFVFIVVAAASSPLAGSVCIVAGSSPLVDAAAVSSSTSFCVCHRPHLPAPVLRSSLPLPLPAPVVAASSSPHRRAPLLPPKKLLLDL
ncbi:hypothetical protein PIB30_056582 [Stylosanthes scabra]|uniref:Uncharacterized protein n=1 Tax=Stylosanthes scabra TaxID=79078 RepID=A0ABU6SJA2_9FABA|nr:hypothetical protein [Stylosanthes scabra]